MSKENQINEFLASSVLAMDEETRKAWDILSDFEKKTIAATAFLFSQGYNQAQRSAIIKNLEFANLWGQ